jgi:hypothetical protein
MVRMAEGSPILTVLESVRCLECAAVYSKPTDGGTVRENPGCPECGYVGWITADVQRPEDAPPTRYGADPRPDRAY